MSRGPTLSVNGQIMPSQMVGNYFTTMGGDFLYELVCLDTLWKEFSWPFFQIEYMVWFVWCTRQLAVVVGLLCNHSLGTIWAI